mmetsp:Transcript_43202/g.78591  ORF Transcript_43202/g.78591 Transcript_43202/m.78591 type:complete len:597 (+) Transcript_43202:81-1871(+)
MAAAELLSQLPDDLRRLCEGLPADAQPEFANLYTRFGFDGDDVEAYQLSGGSMTIDGLKKFEETLKSKVISRRPTPARVSLDSVFNAGGKRRSSLAAATTPSTKRPRVEDVPSADDQAGMPARGTPDPPPKPVQVSTKATFNEKLVVPPPEPQSARLEVQLLSDIDLHSGKRPGLPYTWMDESIEHRAELRRMRWQSLEEELVAASRTEAGDEELAVGSFGETVQSEVVLVGHIVCDGLEGKLNERSLILQSSSRRGCRVHLNVAGCPRLTVFPGQLVGVVGRSGMSGDTFHARLLVPGFPLVWAPRPTLAQGLHAIVAMGPYCTRDALDFSPLDHLLEHVAARRPQVLVLLGPFLDAGNMKVASGETSLPGQDRVLPMDDLYKDHILPRLAQGLAALRKAQPTAKILIVPSLDEVLCLHPLPQPPLDVSLCMGQQASQAALAPLKRLDVQMLPNPAHLQIEGLRISMTSADALSPLLKELVLRSGGRRIEEAYRLLLKQRTLFPVVPREPARVSESHAAALDFPDGIAPHLCILPSAAGVPSGMVVDETIFVNPGQVCKASLGTFAELWVCPEGDNGALLSDTTRVDIQKLVSEK